MRKTDGETCRHELVTLRRAGTLRGHTLRRPRRLERVLRSLVRADQRARHSQRQPLVQ